jgi:hypothetical protein
VPVTHRALQIFVAEFFQSVYVRDDCIPDSDLPVPDDATVIKCTQLKSPKTRLSALFWAKTSTRDPARTEKYVSFHS